MYNIYIYKISARVLVVTLMGWWGGQDFYIRNICSSHICHPDDRGGRIAELSLFWYQESHERVEMKRQEMKMIINDQYKGMMLSNVN